MNAEKRYAFTVSSGGSGFCIIEWFAGWKPVAVARYVVANNENRCICGVDCSAEVGELRFGGMKTAVRVVVLSDGCCVRVVFRVAY